VWVVGSGLAENERLRHRVVTELSRWDPEMIAAGVSATSLGAVVSGARLEGCVRELHRKFFEEPS
jgi:aspartokinase